MNGMARILSRGEKRSTGSSSSKYFYDPIQSRVTADLYSIFSPEDKKKKLSKEEELKVKAIAQRLTALGITSLKDPQIEYALRAKSTDGDVEKAVELLVLFEDALEGILTPYNPRVKLLGAENREAVTCYLDALLFAMFARFDSFEAMLYDTFNDEPRKLLSAVLRLWVNMLRSGRLITVDITKQLQEALSRCGWEDAAKVHQQDASEAFTFITGKLELPMLTLKMDIYHSGKTDAKDDHKIVNERLLEVSIPEPSEDGKPITLEECLESYFNNRIEVKRHLQRRNTLQSHISADKATALHIEVVEVSSRPDSPAPPTPSTPTPPHARPVSTRRRADSIFSQRKVEVGDSADGKSHDDVSVGSPSRQRAISIRNEVMMPAWQFFSLIPWYTETSNAPTNDAQVAAHFSAKRPVLGICLKRYAFLPNGTPRRLDTYIDIPLEIGLPHFISDDRMEEEEGPLSGNFKLSLQSIVCHRGISVDSGHYIALVRGDAPNADNNSTTMSPSLSRPASATSSVTSHSSDSHWLRFDDLAAERVSYVDIAQALKEESPYLLFYQVQPINDSASAPSSRDGAPPPYSEADSLTSADRSTSTGQFPNAPSTTTVNTTPTPTAAASTDAVNWTQPNSPEIFNPALADSSTTTLTTFGGTASPLEEKRGRRQSLTLLSRATDRLSAATNAARTSFESNNTRRSSVVLSAAPSSVATAPDSTATTPGEEIGAGGAKSGFLGEALGRRGSRAGTSGAAAGTGAGAGKKGGSKSRPTSQSGEGNRLSFSMSRLTGKKSRDRLGESAGVGVEELEVEGEDGVGGETVKKGGVLRRSKSKKKHKHKHGTQHAEAGSEGGASSGRKGLDRECSVM
ncbi:hypothetical protein H2201_004908 [Coniosporium apollinis]|uniref:ubiquitinyl hydrolase 1 n=1 Tax=Coniosporium apollinis TaxID=61459 RepID=A0ABQ9NRJ5_9PEZI|nr:hypothetical protein H2201_004908 [Coniosporium apollinis]